MQKQMTGKSRRLETAQGYLVAGPLRHGSHSRGESVLACWHSKLQPGNDAWHLSLCPPFFEKSNKGVATLSSMGRTDRSPPPHPRRKAGVVGKAFPSYPRSPAPPEVVA